MEEDPDVFRTTKPIAEERIQQIFAEIEHSTNIEIPQGLRDIATEEFEEIFPKDQNDLIALILALYMQLDALMTYLRERGEGLNADCKDFIDRLLSELFALTAKKGVKYDFWRHMPQIWHFYKVAEHFARGRKTNISIAYDVDQTLRAYGTCYELTLSFLTDICLKIAEIKCDSDPISRAFVEKYTRLARSDSTIFRADLIKYLHSQSFLKKRQSSVLQDAFIRNKVAHADYYYDAVKNLLYFGNKSYKLEEFRKVLQDLYAFYCYLLYRYLVEAGIMKSLDELERLCDMILTAPQSTEENGGS